MNINIITIGTIKEKYFTDAIKEYTKRLKRYTNLKILELPEEKLGQNSSEKNIEQTLDKEADNILSKIGERDYVIVLAIEGKNISSEQLAETIKDKKVEGYNTFTFIIGSSYGLHDKVKKRADYKLSFSKMTFPHQLMRVILLEQIYRAFKINTNEPYHK